eukprot:5211130-Amphidinium_carterae.1
MSGMHVGSVNGACGCWRRCWRAGDARHGGTYVGACNNLLGDVPHSPWRAPCDQPFASNFLPKQLVRTVGKATIAISK